MRTYEETVANILKKKEKYEAATAKKKKRLSAAAIFAAVLVIAVLIPLAVVMIASRPGGPPQLPVNDGTESTAPFTDPYTSAAETEPVDPYGTSAPDDPPDTGEEPAPCTERLPYYPPDSAYIGLSFDQEDKTEGSFILSESASEVTSFGSAAADIIKRRVKIIVPAYEGKGVKTTVTVKAEDGAVLLSEAATDLGEISGERKYEIVYKYADGASTGVLTVIMECAYDVGLDKPETQLYWCVFFAARVKGVDFIAAGGAAETTARTLFFDAAKYFGDVKTTSVRSGDEEFTLTVPAYGLDPYLKDYYECPASRELRMLFEAAPTEAGLAEIYEANDPGAVFIGGTVAASSGLPGALSGKQIIAYDEAGKMIGVALTNAKGEFVLKLDTGFDEQFIFVYAENGHDFINGKTGNIYYGFGGTVRGGMAIDMGFYDRSTGEIPEYMRIYRHKYGDGKWKSDKAADFSIIGRNRMHIEAKGEADGGTEYDILDIFAACGGYASTVPLRAEVSAGGNAKVTSGTAFVRESGVHNNASVVIGGGRGYIRTDYRYTDVETGEEHNTMTRVICYVIADGFEYFAERDFYNQSANEADNLIRIFEDQCRENAKKSFSAQIVLMHAELIRLKSGDVTSCDAARAAELESKLTAYGIIG